MPCPVLTPCSEITLPKTVIIYKPGLTFPCVELEWSCEHCCQLCWMSLSWLSSIRPGRCENCDTQYLQ